MFTAGLIVFREVFEIAIIVCIIMAATRQVPRRGAWVFTGILGGSMIVALMACFARPITEIATQLGQHLFHALVLLTASLLIGWSVIWMRQHGQQLAKDMRTLSNSVNAGEKPLYMLAFVVGLAVMREGAEIVLFLYGIYATGETNLLDLFFGGMAGLSLGVILGVLMYLGLVRIPVKQLFSFSSYLLSLLAAGMVAKATGHLIKADFIPIKLNGLMSPLWDTSTLLSQHSLVGRFLSIVIGYQDHPATLQVMSYTLTLILIAAIFKHQNRKALT